MESSLFGLSQNQIALIAFLGVLPFLLIAVTSFIKFAVVISLLRNALGIQQIPPNIVIYSLAVVMTGYVMLPVGLEASKVIQSALEGCSNIVILEERVGPPALVNHKAVPLHYETKL